MTETPEEVLAIRDLRHRFPLKGRRGSFVTAVDGLSFSIKAGETFGLVGESGCGKSTVARCILRIYEPTGGTILLKGRDITRLSPAKLKPHRKSMQMIFQDPYSSLNGRMSIEEILTEPLLANRIGKNLRERQALIKAALEHVGLPQEALCRYPHEFSGGQRQRIGIARALILRPALVVCDEPISALDVSIQAQVINMLITFQKELNLAYLFIAHDLSMVRYISNRVGVMYLGRLVEICESHEIYRNPLHPYTQALLEAIPIPDPELNRGKNYSRLTGETPSPINPPPGCPFHPRCPQVRDICRRQPPQLIPAGEVGHLAACHLLA
ncbi:MAG: ABC transporter ATP-binding protein [Spirochaetales bacterium]|jgi:oligopeptide/dipeptide ABC transporter ATP-binding protein|nr:ABC transporter ATP-binding protein [Spirochaetales bacterium]